MRIYQDKIGSSEQAFRNILSEGLLDKYTSGLADQKKKQLVDEVVNTLCLELERFLIDVQNQTVDQISGRLQTKLKNLGLNKIVFSDDALQQMSQAFGGDQMQKFVQAFASINIKEKLDGLKKLFKSNKSDQSAENADADTEKLSEKNGIVQPGNKDEEAEEQEKLDKEFKKLSNEILSSDKKEFVKYCDSVLKNMVFFNGMLDRIYDNTIEYIKPLLKVDITLLMSTIALIAVQGVLAGSVAMMSAANFQLAVSYKYLSLSNFALSAANVVLSIANSALSAANFVHASSVLILAASKVLIAAASVAMLVSVVSAMLSVILSLIMSTVSIVTSVIVSAASIVISLIASSVSIAASLVAFAVSALAAILVLLFQVLIIAFMSAMAIILMVTLIGITLLMMAAMVAMAVILALSLMAIAIVGIGGILGIAIGAVALAVTLVATILVLAAAVLFAALSIVAVAIVIAIMFLEVVALIAATALFAGACLLIIIAVTAAAMAAIGLVTLAVLALEAVLLLSLLLLAFAIAGGLKFVMNKFKNWWEKVVRLAPFISRIKAWWEGSQIKAWINELMDGIKKAGGIKEFLRQFVEEFLAKDPNGKFIYDIIKGIQENGGVWNYFNNTYHIKDLAVDIWGQIKSLLYDLIMEILFGIEAEQPSEKQKSAVAEGFNPGSVTAATPDGIENAQPQFNIPSLDGVEMPQSDSNQNKGDLIDIKDAKESMNRCEDAMKANEDELAQAEKDISDKVQVRRQQKVKEEKETSQSMDDIKGKVRELNDEMHKQQDEIAANSVAGGVAGGAAGSHKDSNSLCHENR